MVYIPLFLIFLHHVLLLVFCPPLSVPCCKYVPLFLGPTAMQQLFLLSITFYQAINRLVCKRVVVLRCHKWKNTHRHFSEPGRILLVLSDKLFKTEIYSIYNDIKRTKESAISHFWDSGTTNCSAILLDKSFYSLKLAMLYIVHFCYSPYITSKDQRPQRFSLSLNTLCLWQQAQDSVVPPKDVKV